MDQNATATAGAGAAIKHLVVLCHPEAHSFNASVARAYTEEVEAAGQAVVLRDLYRMRFSPVLFAWEQPDIRNFVAESDVQDELDLIAGADVLVLVYPIWFGTPPAMLKGYVERVLGSGVGFRDVRDDAHHRLLAGTRLVSFTTSGTTRAWLEERGAWLSLRNVFDRYIAHAFGMKEEDHVHFGGVSEGLPARFADEHLKQVRDRARRLCFTLSEARRRAARQG